MPHPNLEMRPDPRSIQFIEDLELWEELEVFAGKSRGKLKWYLKLLRDSLKTDGPSFAEINRVLSLSPRTTRRLLRCIRSFLEHRLVRTGSRKADRPQG